MPWSLKNDESQIISHYCVCTQYICHPIISYCAVHPNAKASHGEIQNTLRQETDALLAEAWQLSCWCDSDLWQICLDIYIMYRVYPMCSFVYIYISVAGRNPWAQSPAFRRKLCTSLGRSNLQYGHPTMRDFKNHRGIIMIWLIWLIWLILMLNINA